MLARETESDGSIMCRFKCPSHLIVQQRTYRSCLPPYAFETGIGDEVLVTLVCEAFVHTAVTGS